MTKAENLMASFASALKAGAGVHTSADLAYMMNEQQTTASPNLSQTELKKPGAAAYLKPKHVLLHIVWCWQIS